jgi:hypothetical protein
MKKIISELTLYWSVKWHNTVIWALFITALLMCITFFNNSILLNYFSKPGINWFLESALLTKIENEFLKLHIAQNFLTQFPIENFINNPKAYLQNIFLYNNICFLIKHGMAIMSMIVTAFIFTFLFISLVLTYFHANQLNYFSPKKVLIEKPNSFINDFKFIITGLTLSTLVNICFLYNLKINNGLYKLIFVYLIQNIITYLMMKYNCYRYKIALREGEMHSDKGYIVMKSNRKNNYNIL